LRTPDTYTPRNLAEKILTSRAALEGVVTEELIRAHPGAPAQADFEVCNREAAVKTVKLVNTFPACERMAVCHAERSDRRPS
jgi:hypothetical protein